MRRQSGVSLVALLIVIAIMGTLAGLLLPATQSSRRYNREEKNHVIPAEATLGASHSKGISDAYASPNASAVAASGYSRSGRVALDQSLERAGANRKIIYVADMSVVVDDVDAAEKKVLALVKELGGYIAEATVNRAQGQQLSGRWKVRIPDNQFDVFLAEISKLGVVESRNQTTQDVTEEYVDIEAQVANKKKLEDRITALLEKSTDKISDIIAVEHELGRIRGEIERLEGRIKYLANQTSMTTISLTIREKEEYVPELAPTLSQEISEVWENSVASLKGFGQNLLLATVAASPWIVAASVILIPSYWLVTKCLQGKTPNP